jgi:hypothetical protein
MSENSMQSQSHVDSIVRQEEEARKFYCTKPGKCLLDRTLSVALRSSRITGNPSVIR